MSPSLQVDLLTLKMVSLVTCDVGYLCANFGLPGPFCSRLIIIIIKRVLLKCR